MARRYEEAVKSFLAIPSPAYYVHIWLAACLAKLGRLDEARMQARAASDLRPEWTAEGWAIEFKNEADIAHAVELGRLVKSIMLHEVWVRHQSYRSSHACVVPILKREMVRCPSSPILADLTLPPGAGKRGGGERPSVLRDRRSHVVRTKAPDLKERP